MSTSTSPSPSGELGALLEWERVVAEQVAAAGREADAVIQEARTAASRREASLTAELESTARALDDRLSADRNRRIADIAAAARHRIEALDALDAPAIERAAAAVTAALVRAMASGGPE
jgi:hypothetical protein